MVMTIERIYKIGEGSEKPFKDEITKIPLRFIIRILTVK